MKSRLGPVQPEGGFTLIEILLGLALTLGLGLGVSSLVSLSAKAERNSAMLSEQLEMMSVIRQTLSSPASCTANLANLKLDTDKFTAVPVELYFTKLDPAKPTAALKAAPIIPNQKYGKLSIQMTSVQAYAQLTADVWLVKVLVAGKKTGTFLGGESIAGEVSTQVRINPATSEVVNCVGHQDLTLALTDENSALNEKICEISSGGTKIYDPITKTCVMNEDCVNGTLNEAACPVGTRIVGCNSAGSVDTTGLTVSRQFKSAIHKASAPTYVCSIDAIKNSATCEYGLNGVDTSAAVCRACCRSESNAKNAK